jgi:hypothetical protein
MANAQRHQRAAWHPWVWRLALDQMRKSPHSLRRGQARFVGCSYGAFTETFTMAMGSCITTCCSFFLFGSLLDVGGDLRTVWQMSVLDVGVQWGHDLFTLNPASRARGTLNYLRPAPSEPNGGILMLLGGAATVTREVLFLRPVTTSGVANTTWSPMLFADTFDVVAARCCHASALVPRLDPSWGDSLVVAGGSKDSSAINECGKDVWMLTLGKNSILYVCELPLRWFFFGRVGVCVCWGGGGLRA